MSVSYFEAISLCSLLHLIELLLPHFHSRLSLFPIPCYCHCESAFCSWQSQRLVEFPINVEIAAPYRELYTCFTCRNDNSIFYLICSSCLFYNSRISCYKLIFHWYSWCSFISRCRRLNSLKG